MVFTIWKRMGVHKRTTAIIICSVLCVAWTIVLTYDTHFLFLHMMKPFHWNYCETRYFLFIWLTMNHFCQLFFIVIWNNWWFSTKLQKRKGVRRGRDRMVVGFITTYASVVRSTWTILQIKFVCDLRQVGSFLRVLLFPPPIKLTATILLKYCWKWR